jgi:CheY-like chemotaxis protein
MKTDAVPSVRILLVDDNELGLTARRMILEDAGYGVETAVSGEDAWELFQKTQFDPKTQFDIVVTDFRMGGMDGAELIRLIRGSGSPARIILLSGFASCLGMTVESSGADEVLCKSNKEVPELLRALKRLAVQPARRGAASATRLLRRKSNAG